LRDSDKKVPFYLVLTNPHRRIKLKLQDVEQ